MKTKLKITRKDTRKPICIGADSLHAGEPFFRKCAEMEWHYIVRFQKKCGFWWWW